MCRKHFRDFDRLFARRRGAADERATDRNTLSGKLAAERQGLRLNSQHLARLNNFDCVNRSRDERHEILQGIACATEHDDSQFPFGEILLELKISIPRHEDGEADGFSGIEKLSVL